MKTFRNESTSCWDNIKGEFMAKKVHVFISQPMRGRSEEGIDRERKLIMDDLVAKVDGEVVEIKSHFDSSLVDKMKPLDCLGNSIKLMSHADLVVFAPMWETARGCRIEHECAVQYGYPILDLSDGQWERNAG